MSKKPAAPERRGSIVIPFEPFYGSVILVGAECIIVSEDDERYVVKFPAICSACKSQDEKAVSCVHGIVGHSGTYHIKKTYVKEALELTIMVNVKKDWKKDEAILDIKTD